MIHTIDYYFLQLGKITISGKDAKKISAAHAFLHLLEASSQHTQPSTSCRPLSAPLPSLSSSYPSIPRQIPPFTRPSISRRPSNPSRAPPPSARSWSSPPSHAPFRQPGTVITRFVNPAYAAIRDEFRRQANATDGYGSMGAFDTCYSTAAATCHNLNFDGLDLVLPAENAMIHSSGRPLACLAMAAAPANVDAVLNVFASYQQQNLRVLLDVPASSVGFGRELCTP